MGCRRARQERARHAAWPALALVCLSWSAEPEELPGQSAPRTADAPALDTDLARPPRAQIPADAALEAAGAVIGRIHVEVGNVFDLQNPAENNALYRLGNRLHLRTREHVVVRQLLFRSGDRYERRLLQESERILRRNPYLYDAQIRPVSYADNVVDVEVITRDVWSLSPQFSFSRSGGENTYGVGLSESNLLGLGKDLKIARNSNVDRDETLLRYIDTYLLGTRNELALLYSDNSDGELASMRLRRPFFALDTRWAASLAGFDGERVDKLYDLGEAVEQFRHEQTLIDLHYGRSTGLVDGWVRRWSVGYGYQRDRFAVDPTAPAASLPQDRTLAYPYVAFELIEDRFRETSDQDQIGRTEDLFLGTRLRLQLGWSDDGFGADRDAAIVQAGIASGFAPSVQQTLLVSAGAGARVESGRGVRNLLIGGNLRYYHRNFGGDHSFFAGLDLALADRLDGENQLLLGGDTGLRGYPLRYQGGEQRALATLEQRFYTDWYPFRLVRVGAAAFFDIGRTWGEAHASTPSLGWLRDVGVGLRLSPTRSASQVVHIDVAFPLDGEGSIDDLQLLVETKARF